MSLTEREPCSAVELRGSATPRMTRGGYLTFAEKKKKRAKMAGIEPGTSRA